MGTLIPWGHFYFMLSFLPVSYTHLDVYKRQFHFLFHGFMAFYHLVYILFPEFAVTPGGFRRVLKVFGRAPALAPVSYTHLDVYKRQMLLSMAVSFNMSEMAT